MPFISADRIHNGARWLPAGTVLEVGHDGVIAGFGDAPHQHVTYYEGVLAPGFVNVHCHLELSHMKGVAPEGTGLIPFLKTIPLHRNDFTEEQKKQARDAAYAELIRNGVIAVGDIANTTDTADVRALDGLHMHTFVECIGFSEGVAPRSYERSRHTMAVFSGQPRSRKVLRQSITPHAPYSVSRTLFGLIGGDVPGSILSIHNQESEAENAFFLRKEGGIRDLLQSLGIDDGPFEPTGLSSLRSYAPLLGGSHTAILVHNTYSSREDVQFAKTQFTDVHWCLCPNANLYIEGRLPDIDMLINESRNICVGTDSLASNHQLSILAELNAINTHFPAIGWETLLAWGTGNGARALGMDHVGTIAPGMQPGIVHIMGMESGRPAVVRVA